MIYLLENMRKKFSVGSTSYTNSQDNSLFFRNCKWGFGARVYYLHSYKQRVSNYFNSYEQRNKYGHSNLFSHFQFSVYLDSQWEMSRNITTSFVKEAKQPMNLHGFSSTPKGVVLSTNYFRQWNAFLKINGWFRKITDQPFNFSLSSHVTDLLIVSSDPPASNRAAGNSSVSKSEHCNNLAPVSDNPHFARGIDTSTLSSSPSRQRENKSTGSVNGDVGSATKSRCTVQKINNRIESGVVVGIASDSNQARLIAKESDLEESYSDTDMGRGGHDSLDETKNNISTGNETEFFETNNNGPFPSIEASTFINELINAIVHNATLPTERCSSHSPTDVEVSRRHLNTELDAGSFVNYHANSHIESIVEEVLSAVTCKNGARTIDVNFTIGAESVLPQDELLKSRSCASNAAVRIDTETNNEQACKEKFSARPCSYYNDPETDHIGKESSKDVSEILNTIVDQVCSEAEKNSNCNTLALVPEGNKLSSLTHAHDNDNVGETKEVLDIINQGCGRNAQLNSVGNSVMVATAQPSSQSIFSNMLPDENMEVDEQVNCISVASCSWSKNEVLSQGRGEQITESHATSIWLNDSFLTRCEINFSKRLNEDVVDRSDPRNAVHLNAVWQINRLIINWNPERIHVGPILGQGSFGRVYKCQDSDGRILALKIIDRAGKGSTKWHSTITDTIRECEVQKGAACPYSISPYAYCCTAGNIFIAMECGEGSLESWVFPDDPVYGNAKSESEAAAVIKDICLGLCCLAHRGIVHCDLKLDNIIKTSDFKYKISDFGLAVYLNRFGRARMRTFVPNHAAPELAGNGDYGTGLDMWSLGLIMYEIICGTRMYHGMLRTSLGGYIPTNGIEVSRSGKNLLTRLLSLDENDRPSARSVLEDVWMRENLK